MSLIINSSRNAGFEPLVAAAAPASPGQDLRIWLSCSPGAGSSSTSLQDAAGTSPQHSCLGLGSGGHQGVSCPGLVPVSSCLQSQCPKYLYFFYTSYVSALSTGRDGALEAEAPV